MAYTTINKGSSYFNTKLYTGNSSTQSITGVGFQPDLVWMKVRSTTGSHRLTDAVRGNTKLLQTNASDADQTGTDTLTSFDNDGFSLGADTAPYRVNVSGDSMVAWNWKANGAGSSNTDGSITSTVSANTTSGFSIVTYTGTGSASTVGHGLGATPKVIIAKRLDSTQNWLAYHSTQGATKGFNFNTTDAVITDSGYWGNTEPTSSVFTAGTYHNGNYVAYCFAEKKGFSKFGSYTGNGSADGTFVYLGFKPAMVILKSSSNSATNWQINDSTRDTYNVVNKRLAPSANDAEATNFDFGDFLSNGFKIRQSDQTWNASGATYIYMAFAEHPLVSSTGTPCTAR